MELKNLFEPAVKQEIIDRINKLTPATQRKWGTMEVAQMLAHVQRPLGVATGDHKIKGSFLLRLFGPLAKNSVFGPKPFKRNLPTDKSFKISDHREFEKERNLLIDMINRFSAETMIDEPHPIFGRLTKEEWSKGSWKHLDHHLQQFGV
jgi:hypothetical protein